MKKTIYTMEHLEQLEEQERILSFHSFGRKEALYVGNEIEKEALTDGREISAQIIREDDELVLFQNVIGSKKTREQVYMLGKRQAVIITGHSSLWTYVSNKVEGKWCQDIKREPLFLAIGGGFPIYVGRQLVATISLSGLYEGKDHEIVIRALEKVLGRKCPVFTGVAV